MHRFKHRVRLTHVRAWHNAQTAHQTRRQIRNNIAVEIRQQQNVERFRPITSCIEALSTISSLY